METEIQKVEEKTEKAIADFKPNPAFISAGSLLPKNYRDVMELSVILAKSGVVPKELIGRPEACAVAIMFGLELGLTPTQAVQNIMIVNGRPSLWGDALKALVVGSGKCMTFDEDAPHIALQQGFGRCRLVRRQEFGGGEVEIVFTREDAERAKLWSKEGPWRSYPGRMLMFRARSWACRDLFGDVLKGMQMREELDDYEIIHPPVKMPERAKPPRMAVDAQIVAERGDTPREGDKAPQNASQEAERGIGGQVASAEIANEGQEPGNAPGDTADFKISDERRRTLFKLRSEAKISLDLAKAWMKEHDLKDTSEMTNRQADEFEAWIKTTVKR